MHSCPIIVAVSLSVSRIYLCSVFTQFSHDPLAVNVSNVTQTIAPREDWHMMREILTRGCTLILQRPRIIYLAEVILNLLRTNYTASRAPR